MGQDEIGKRFERWVIVDAAKRYNGSRVWKCVCDCGKVKNVRGEALANGRSKSCGCLAVDKRRARKKPVKMFICAECKQEREDKTRVGDVCARCWEALMPSSGVQVGMRFGRLLVTKLRPMIALCDCGNIVTNRKAHDLAFGRLRSCGCLRAEKRRVYGPSKRWSAVELINPDAKSAHQRFRVTCSQCGHTCERGIGAVARDVERVGCQACAAAKVRAERKRIAASHDERQARKEAAE